MERKDSKKENQKGGKEYIRSEQGDGWMSFVD
jgi:hypothetical protein